MRSASFDDHGGFLRRCRESLNCFENMLLFLLERATEHLVLRRSILSPDFVRARLTLAIDSMHVNHPDLVMKS